MLAHKHLYQYINIICTNRGSYLNPRMQIGMQFVLNVSPGLFSLIPLMAAVETDARAVLLLLLSH